MRALIAAAVLTSLAAVAAAQEPALAPDKPKQETGPGVAVETTPPRRGFSLTNVRVDLTLTDQTGSRPPVKKTMTITLADGERGSVRSRPQVALSPQPGAARLYQTLPLNVDARPQLVDGKVRLLLILEYSSIDQAPEGSGSPKADVNFSGQVLLDSGRPMVVAEAADPVSDRRVTVEVKATIVR
jgi:hypothetical protein